MQAGDHISNEQGRQGHGHAALEGVGADRVPQVLVQEHPRHPPEGAADVLQLLQGLGTHQDPLPAVHRVPDDGAVFGHGAHEAVGPAVLFDLRERPRGIDRDGDVVGMQQ